jgi:purine nucleosidase
MMPCLIRRILSACALCVCATVFAQTTTPRYVIADQDASGPGGSDMAALLVFLQSPDVNLLGITVVSGDAWRDVEVAHTLRLLELMGRTDVKVYPGAAFPLVRTQEWTRLASKLFGKVTYMGAWNERNKLRWDEVPDLQEGNPTTKAADEDAAHFMVRMVHEHPHEVTIYGAGPLTNIALAIKLDPHFAELAQELVIMGGSINPHTEAAEWVNAPRHEFNLWFDPEAASIALTAKWPKISATTIDSSIQTHITPVLRNLATSNSNAARYLIQYARHNNSAEFAWDELAAATWLDPAITVHERVVYMDVNIDHGPNYGDVLTFSDNDKPELSLQKVHAQIDVDGARLERDLATLFGAPTPHAHNPALLPVK